jgi:cytochrome c oxidase cbb3-type subunit 4
MDYAQVSLFAQTWGLVLLGVCFAIAVIYALWPGNRDAFRRAASRPLQDEDPNGRE